MKEKTYWLSPLTVCDCCSGEFNKTMYDASAKGLWGNFCQSCFTALECKTGIGLGQKYELQESGKWLCTEGGINNE